MLFWPNLKPAPVKINMAMNVENARKNTRQGEEAEAKRKLRCAESHIPFVNDEIYDAGEKGNHWAEYRPESSQRCTKWDIVGGLTTIYKEKGYSVYYPDMEKADAIGFMWHPTSE
jgi:hypothetical protein